MEKPDHTVKAELCFLALDLDLCPSVRLHLRQEFEVPEEATMYFQPIGLGGRDPHWGMGAKDCKGFYSEHDITKMRAAIDECFLKRGKA